MRRQRFSRLGDVLGLITCKRSSDNRQVLVGFQSTESIGRLQHAGSARHTIFG